MISYRVAAASDIRCQETNFLFWVESTSQVHRIRGLVVAFGRHNLLVGIHLSVLL